MTNTVGETIEQRVSRLETAVQRNESWRIEHDAWSAAARLKIELELESLKEEIARILVAVGKEG